MQTHSDWPVVAVEPEPHAKHSVEFSAIENVFASQSVHVEEEARYEPAAHVDVPPGPHKLVAESQVVAPSLQEQPVWSESADEPETHVKHSVEFSAIENVFASQSVHVEEEARYEPAAHVDVPPGPLEPHELVSTLHVMALSLHVH